MPNMNLEQINDSIRTVGARVSDLSSRLALAATQAAPDMQEVARLQDELQRESGRLNALRESAAALGAGQQTQLPNQQPARDARAARTLHDLRSSNEYARAFALAMRRGLTPDSGRGVEELNPLFDALTIGGGDPVGEDGGFLVPEDVDHRIRELMRALNPLRDFFATETVTAPTGWRVTDTAPTTGFSQVNEMATVPSNDQPVFGKVTYALAKYGLILPISNELLSDEVGNLLAYISRWAAKKEVITENTLLLAALAGLDSTATDIAANNEHKGIKTILNTGLDPAIAQRAVLITNQDGFNVLDCLEDEMGRPLMQRDLNNPTQRLFAGHRVAVLANSVLASANSKAPVYIGDGEQYATLFERAAMEIVSTKIGGTAFTTDSTQMRFIKRMGVSKFDTAAMKKATLAL